MDLLDHYRPGGGLSLRKIGVLVGRLPAESATSTAIRNATPPEQASQAARFNDPTTAPWSTDQMLLASVIDELRFLRHTVIQVNSEKAIGKPPEPMPRPGTKRKKILTSDQRAMLDPRTRMRGR